MDLSIVIVNWNVRELLDCCLDSIYRNVRGLTFEVVVVDNASHDASVEMVRSRYPQVQVIANAENAGFCRGNNQGIEATTGDFVCLLNPDTEVYPGAMERLVGFLRERPDVGVVGPRLSSPPGVPTRPNGTMFPSFTHELLGVMAWHRPNKEAFERRSFGRSSFDETAEVDVVCGACLLTRRQVVEQIGGLDEALFMFFDEVDFCLRAKRAGWRVFVVPDAEILHVWMGSVKQDTQAGTRRLNRARFVFFRKHHGIVPAAALWLACYLSEQTRLARVRAVHGRDRLLGRRRAGDP